MSIFVIAHRRQTIDPQAPNSMQKNEIVCIWLQRAQCQLKLFNKRQMQNISIRYPRARRQKFTEPSQNKKKSKKNGNIKRNLETLSDNSFAKLRAQRQIRIKISRTNIDCVPFLIELMNEDSLWP